MILSLRIEKLSADRYRGRIFDGSELLGEVYQSNIAVVIGETAKAFQPAPQAFNIYYGPVSIGTIIRARMVYDAETYAHRLAMLEALLA